MTTIPSLPFSGQQLRDALTALDGAIDGKEASGAAAAAVAAHVAAVDPHTQYTTAVEAAAAAPVQGVALSVPSGWSGSSANVGGNVTLTLGLPAGSSLVGSSDRTSWDAAFTERNRWDGGATGLNASTGRSSLGLGNVDNTSDASKPVSTATATALAGKANTGAIGSSGLTMATARLLGRSTAGSGAPEEVTLGANLTLSGGILSASVTGGGGGTVSSVGLVAPTGFSVSGSPVTSSGNITLSFAAGYSLPTTSSQSSWDAAAALAATAVQPAGLASYVQTSDARLTDSREWSATTITQAEAEAGTATTRRAFTAQRVFQAVAAWWAASSAKTKLDGIATGAQVNVATDLTYTALTMLLESSTGADVTLPLVTSTAAGLAPLSGGGTSNFLRADGTWAAPAGGAGGGSTNYQEFTSSGTWTKPAGCTTLYIEVIAGGGGGGSGRRGAAGTVRAGGAGGAGGRFVSRWIAAAAAAATETITVGAGGAGGAAVSSDDASGATGSNGGSSSFGTLVIASETSGGAGGATGAATGGSAAPWGPAALVGLYAATGASSAATGAAGTNASRCMHGGGGGGSAAGIGTTNFATSGGAGGEGYAELKNTGATAVATGGGGAAGVLGAIDGGSGLAYGDGGGGGRSSTSSASGNGGNGAAVGGGGGGGAGSLNGFGSGAGGNGGGGVVRIWAW